MKSRKKNILKNEKKQAATVINVLKTTVLIQNMQTEYVAKAVSE